MGPDQAVHKLYAPKYTLQVTCTPRDIQGSASSTELVATIAKRASRIVLQTAAASQVTPMITSPEYSSSDSLRPMLIFKQPWVKAAAVPISHQHTTKLHATETTQCCRAGMAPLLKLA